MLGPTGRIPHSPDSPTDRVAGVVGPQLLRPLLLQRPRPHRRHLPDHRHRLLPQPRGQGRVRPRPSRRHPDRRAPERRHRLRTGSTSTCCGYRVEVSEPLHKLRIDPRGNRGHRRRPDLERAVRRRSRSSGTCCGRARESRWTRSVSPRWAAGAASSRSTARRSPSTPRCGSAAATGRGASGRSAKPSPRAGPRIRRSRACGGCTCRWRSTTSRSCLIIQEEPSGFRSLNDCTRIWRDGRVEQLGWPRVKIHYTSGTRIPTGATIDGDRADGSPVHFDVESKLPVPIHVGGGYGGDSDWMHGMWKGDKFTERLTYDMTDPAIVGRAGFGVIDHVGRAVCTEGGKSVEGWGLFEHGALGRHDPSGFADWLTVAP